MAFVWMPDGANQELFLIKRDDSGLRQITFTNGISEWNPDWPARGRYLERARACRASVAMRLTISPAGRISWTRPALCPAAGKSSCTRPCVKTGSTSPRRRSASLLASCRRSCHVSMKGVRRARNTVPYPWPQAWA